MILHAPRLSCNLFSVIAVVKRGHTVKFGQLILEVWPKFARNAFCS